MGLASDWLMVLLSRVTAGRDGETVTGRVRVRPSLRETWAVRCSPGWSCGGLKLGGSERRRSFSDAGPPLGFAGAGVKVRSLRMSFWTWSRREPESWAAVSPAW